MKKFMLSAALGAMLISNTIIASAQSSVKINNEGSKDAICITSTDNPKNSDHIVFIDDPAGW